PIPQTPQLPKPPNTPTPQTPQHPNTPNPPTPQTPQHPKPPNTPNHPTPQTPHHTPQHPKLPNTPTPQHPQTPQTSQHPKPPNIPNPPTSPTPKTPQSTFLLMYVNEMHCVVAAYTFQAPSSAVCKDWTENLSTAQKQLELLRSREAWISHQHFKQLQDEGQGSRNSAPSSPTPARRDSIAGETSPSEMVAHLPQLLLTRPEDLEVGSEPELEAQEGETGLGPPASPGLTRRPRSPARFGAQRFIERRLRKEDGPGRSPPAEGPAIWAQALEGAWEELPEEEQEIQAPEQAVKIQDQALVQGEPELGLDSRPQSPDWAQQQEEVEESPKFPGLGSVLETLQRAKAMQGRPVSQGSEVVDESEVLDAAATSSRQRTLTLAELQRIRSPLYMNSTLTTSEV
uniref:pleckstrin homology domain-containing family G member 5-like n=1 Tax=Pristiophorus japonicus TaxID=55135 RepID=UPI00398F0FF6